MKPKHDDSANDNANDFDIEVELLRNNPEFMALMKRLSQEKAAISLKDLRKELGV